MVREKIIEQVNQLNKDLKDINVVMDIITNLIQTNIFEEDFRFIIDNIILPENQLWTNVLKPTLLGKTEEETVQDNNVNLPADKVENVAQDDDLDVDYDSEVPDGEDDIEQEQEIEIKKEVPINKKGSDIIKETLDKIRRKPND